MKAFMAPPSFMKGFTLVELVITLVLISILSALGIGLLASPSTYSAGAARDQFVATAQLAQQWSLANSGDQNRIGQLHIEESSGEWAFSVRTQSGELIAGPKVADRGNATLEELDSLSIDFDNQGRLSTNEDIEVRFSGESDHFSCISALGFAYPGPCP